MVTMTRRLLMLVVPALLFLLAPAHASPRIKRQEKPCVCVPYYQCGEDGKLEVYGEGQLDVRIPTVNPTCTGLDTCCELPDDYVENPNPPVDPSVIPPVEPPVRPPTPTPSYEPDKDPRVPPKPDSEFIVVPERPAGLHGCGVKRVSSLNERIPISDNDTAIRITGPNGKPDLTFYGEFPWMVAILKQSNNGQFTFGCGGSIISSEVVLTAAHCVAALKPEELSVIAGDWDSRIEKLPLDRQRRHVKKIIVHEEFNHKNLINDVALLYVDTPFQFSETVDTICIVNEDFNPSHCQATGWGKNVFGDTTGQYQPVLRKVRLPLVERSDCQERLRKTRLGKYFKLHKSFICAGGIENADTCTGDGGGPLVCAGVGGHRQRYAQVGIVSWGIECGTKNPAVYTSVKHFYSWIQAHVPNI